MIFKIEHLTVPESGIPCKLLSSHAFWNRPEATSNGSFNYISGSGLEDGKLQGTLGRAVANLLDARLVKAGVVMSLLCVRERALRCLTISIALTPSFRYLPYVHYVDP